MGKNYQYIFVFGEEGQLGDGFFTPEEFFDVSLDLSPELSQLMPEFEPGEDVIQRILQKAKELL